MDMFLAHDKAGNLVNVLEDKIEKGNYYCPACQQQVCFKNGRKLRPHFAHRSLQDCSVYWENESAEHLNLKASLLKWGQAHHRLQVEAFLPQVEQIADLLVDEKLALEVQCSPLSLKRLQERTDSYHSQGYQVLWLLGRKLWLKKSLTNLQKNFLYFSQNMGFHLWELDDEGQILRLKYLIHEDLHGQVHYKEKLFPFYEGDLLAVLRQPFQKQAITSFLAKQDRQICHYVRQQLYYQQPKWMQWQAELYQLGDNLLTKQAEDFYPQVRPVQAQDFCQIKQDLQDYYQQFLAYYAKEKNKNLQIIYPPAFYARILP